MYYLTFVSTFGHCFAKGCYSFIQYVNELINLMQKIANYNDFSPFSEGAKAVIYPPNVTQVLQIYVFGG
jgi:hypothetical protein